ncbi:MAG: hypothetical protein ACRBFS_21670 [Aureispira sp.]
MIDKVEEEEEFLGNHQEDFLEALEDDLEDDLKISEGPEKILEEALEDLEVSKNFPGDVFKGEKELWKDGNALLNEKEEEEEEEEEYLGNSSSDPLIEELLESSMEEEEAEEEEEELEGFDLEEEDDLDDFDEEDLDPSNWDKSSTDELVDELQEGQDPFNAAEQIDEVKEYSPFMGELTTLAFEKADHWRAKLCAHISGEHLTYFVSGKREMNLLKLAFKEYLASVKVTQPSPFAQLLIAIGAWGIPSLMMAYMMGRGKKKEVARAKSAPAAKQATKAAPSPRSEVEIVVESNSPYQHLREYQEKRKRFKLHQGKGTYQYSPDGKVYRTAPLADEKPSPVIAAWIAEGKKNAFINDQLYGS